MQQEFKRDNFQCIQDKETFLKQLILKILQGLSYLENQSVSLFCISVFYKSSFLYLYFFSVDNFIFSLDHYFDLVENRLTGYINKSSLLLNDNKRRTFLIYVILECDVTYLKFQACGASPWGCLLDTKPSKMKYFIHDHCVKLMVILNCASKG